MTKEQALSFLIETEKYFQMKAIMSNEDIMIQAYTQNAFNISKVIKLIEENIK